MSRCNEKPSLTLILGSGFSSEAKLPTTKDLVKHFLKHLTMEFIIVILKKGLLVF